MFDMASAGKLKEKLKLKGYKMTRQREAILDAFLACASHLMTAHQLFTQVMIKEPQTNFSTVYRNLEMLVQEGIVNKVIVQDKTHAYELNVESEHHHHMICMVCGNVQCIDYCPIDNISEKHGFKHTDHRLEIYGFCKECSRLQTT
jgi:Fur family zinc uptake transcriptional regulator/Fur family ferric uptake transcriptional regulator